MAALDVKTIIGSFDFNGVGDYTFEILADAGNENLFKFAKAYETVGSQSVALGITISGQSIDYGEDDYIVYQSQVLPKVELSKNWIISDTVGLVIHAAGNATQSQTLRYQVVMVEAK